MKSLSSFEQLSYFERMKEYEVELSKLGYIIENRKILNDDEEENEEEEEKMEIDGKDDDDGYESSASVDSTLPDEND